MSKMFPVVNLDAAEPYERGVQYGKAVGELISKGIGNYRRRYEEDGKDWNNVKKYAMTFIPLLEQRMSPIVAEARGIADGAGVPLEEIMVLNTRYEISQPLNECTTAVTLPESTERKCTYLVKNWDYLPALVDTAIIVRYKLPNGVAIIGLTEAGQLVREGFNNYGVGLCNNGIQSIHDYLGVGIPVTFLRRQVLESKSFEEAFGWLTKSPRSASNNMLLCDGKNGRAIDIEAYPGGCYYLEPISGIITHANHFVCNPALDKNKDALKVRDTRLRYLLLKNNGKITLDTIFECMKDHDFYPKSICNHAYDPSSSDMRGLMTVASMVCDFENELLYVCRGNPCEGDYVPFSLRA